MERLRLTVVGIAVEAVDILSFELRPTGGEPLPPFTAGAHIDVDLPGDLTRQYSLCNDPAERHRYVIAVKRETPSRGGSEALHTAIGIGDSLAVSPPRNRFGLDLSATRSLLLAAGIGVTPLLSMQYMLTAGGHAHEMHYFVRAPEAAAFHDILRDRATIHTALTPDATARQLETLLRPCTPGTHVYICGPRPFIDLAVKHAADWPNSAVHVEHFINTVPDDAPTGRFTVDLAQRDRTLTVPPDKTLLEVLREAGVSIDWSCEQGVCGTCQVNVISGSIEHRDVFLTDEERAQGDIMMACISRAKGRLVLDL